MPFLLPAAATAVAAAAPAAAATTAAAAAGATLTSIATNIAMNVAISAVMSALQPNVGAAGRSSEWTLSPDGPIPFAAGRIGVAGSVVHRATFGPDLMYLGVPAVLSGAGPIDGYESFRADDEFVTFDANGKAVSSQYAGELWFKRTFGDQPDVAITSPAGLKNGSALSGWSTAHKLSGKAAYMVVMGENSKGTAFPTGEIKPLIVFRGLRGWDPRLDSTWPGGVGPCRLNDPSTWVYLRRPGLWGLKWSLGLWEDPVGKGAPQVGTQVGGIGAKLSGIDVQAFINLENICDANDWTVCGYPTTDDDKFAVLESFLQAGGATFSMRAGKISCIQRAAPRTSIVTIGAGDTAGPLEIDTAASRIDRINTIRPRIISEGHRWQLTAITEVTAATYREQDGGTRPRGIDYTYVSDATQGAQLAALQIANTREGIAGVIPLKPHLQKIKPGDAFTITEPGFVLNGLKCLCLSTDFDPTTKIVAVSFVSETDTKYPFALGQSQVPPEPPVLEPVDPRYVSPPGETEWEIVVRPPAEGGAQVPGFDLVGEVDNATATALLVEWGPTAEGPWTQAYLGPPTAERIPITGVQPNAVYYVSTMNIRDQNYSQRRVFGPFTAPPLVSNDTVNVGDMPSGDVAAAASQVPGLALTLAGAQLAIATHQATLYQATTGLVDRVAALMPAVFDPATGLTYRMGQAETKVDGGLLRIGALETSVNTPGTGLSALYAAQQSAILDLQTGKASVASVALLEAKGQTRPNLLINPTGVQGFQSWSNNLGGDAGWQTGIDRDFGSWFFRPMTGQGPINSYWGQEVAAGPGQQLVLSGNRYVNGLTAGNAFVEVAYFNGATYTGVGATYNVPLGASILDKLPDVVTPVSPAGTTRAMIYFGVYGAVGAPGFAYVGFYRMKLETGTVSSAFSDERSAAQLSGRASTLEGAVVDLTAGKADVSRVVQLEARAGGTNLLSRSIFPTGTAQSDYTPWVLNPTYASPDGGVWPYNDQWTPPGQRSLFQSIPAGVGAGNYSEWVSEPIIIDQNKRYCAAARSGLLNAAGQLPAVGQASLFMYVCNAQGVPQSNTGPLPGDLHNAREARGGQALSNAKQLFNFSSPTGNTTAEYFGLDQVQTIRVVLRVSNGPGNAETLYSMWNQIGLYEVPLTATQAPPWSDSATTARITELKQATADLTGRLEGRLLLNVIAGNQVAGGQLLAVDGPDSSFSVIDWWAQAFRVSNGGANPIAPFEVRGDVVRMRAALIDRLSVTTAITVGTFAFPVALEAKLQPAADGEVVSYGGPLGQVPALFFRTDGLDPLNAGESYLQYAEGHTETGFIARRKIQTPATPSSFNLTTSAAGPGGTGPTRIIERGANPKSVDDTYFVTGSGYVRFRSFLTEVPEYTEGQSGTATFEVQQRVGGAWSLVGYLYVYANSYSEQGFGSQAYNEDVYGDGAAEVTCSASVEAWGLRYLGQDGGINGGLYDIDSVSWTAQGTGSGVRSATSGGQRPIIEVRLKNA